MNQLRFRPPQIELIGLSLLAALLYRSGIFIFLYLVPLQVLYEHRGEKYLLGGAVASIAAIMLVGLLRLARSADQVDISAPLLLDLAIPTILSGGLWLLNTQKIGLAGRLNRLLLATIAAGGLAIPIIALLARNEALMQLVSQQMEAIARALTSELNEDPQQIEATVEMLLTTTVNALLATFLLTYTILLGAGWYVGTLIGRFARSPRFRLAHFRAPHWMIWILCGSLAGVLLGLLTDIGALGYVVWNATLVSLLVYVVQGTAILWFLIGRFAPQMQRRLWFIMVAVVVMLIPLMNILAFLITGGLGVAEIWIDFGRKALSAGRTVDRRE